jgi:acyl-CoA dehydrogenase
MQELANSDKRWTIHPAFEELKVKARAEGLWNLWISASLADEIRHLLPPNPQGNDALLLGVGLTNLVSCTLAWIVA